MTRSSDRTDALPGGRPPERDSETPYEAVDVDELPGWWSEAIEEFREHDLPPYRPPRFADDVITPPVVERLQSEYDAEIKFMGVGVEYRDAWGVYVDGERILTVDREREPAGYTRYRVTSDTFERAVRDHFAELEDETE
ncbi:hypothetical protein ACFOZ7_11825 [Natribaculum luteum]|uniref:Uncharacterized protein n=1 Tax=Natribaculum luteum TaxID=1586232 RepID=A0ABD5P109_9EURY|nr:hypothetical protein [Natribaculum luteum]